LPALGLAAAFAVMAGPASAEISAETQYVLNSFSFLMTGALVMWMAAGFAMLESGLVRTKNTASICLKNIALYSIAGLTG
jgi:Amt family ammonium transporter